MKECERRISDIWAAPHYLNYARWSAQSRLLRGLRESWRMIEGYNASS